MLLKLVMAAASPAAAAERSTIPLPGGAAALAEAAGLRRASGLRVLLDVTRVTHDAPPGDAPVGDARRAHVLAYLAAIPPGSPTDDVLLPLTPDLWREILGRPVPDDQLALEILRDRAAALLYTGLFSLDDDTLAWLAQNRGTLADIYQNHSAIFGAFGRSIKVRGGRIDAPGGGQYDAVWERLVDRPVSRPDAFVIRLLSRGNGRLAFFYDAMAHTDPARLRFAMSSRVDDLYDVFARPEEEWRPARRPFNRTAVDGALLFAAILVDDNGRLVGPSWTKLWDDVFSNTCAASQLDTSQAADAAWLASRIVAPGVGRARERLRLLLFAQRVFPSPSPQTAIQIRDALCGLARAPALMLTLERLGARDPALYARAGALARNLPGSAQDGDRRARLAIIQSALEFVALARQGRTISADAATALVTGLVDAAEASLKEGASTVVDWVDATLVPAFAKASGLAVERTPVERILLAAAAGVRADVTPPVVEWEGMKYNVDPAGARLANALRIRSRQASLDLDASMAAHRIARGRPAPADEAQFADALERWRAAERENPADDEDGNGGHVSPESIAAKPTEEQADTLVADAFVSMMYALTLGPASSAAARASNVARRHALRGITAGGGPTSADVAWDIPFEEFGPRGWMVRGSLLGLDVGLSRLCLRRQLDTGLPAAPNLNDNDRRTLTDTVRLMAWSDMADADRDALVAAISRGTERARALLAEPSKFAILAAEAGMDETRRTVMTAIAARDAAAAFDDLWLSELVRIGKPEIPADRLNAWGTATLPLEGGLAVRYPAVGDGCLLAGRPAIGMTAMTMPDPTLRVAIALADLRLPAALAPDMLAFVTQFVIDEALTVNSDDRDAIAKAARAVTAEHIVDIVAALTAEGPLVPRRLP
ncbi:MAG TPA: hypothetical protein VHJ77_06760 [Vicinamibacterales bacterium]|nr:hypothetical protein [Vicinamibacterales bacterium]